MASDPINAALPPELYDWKDGQPNLFNYAPRKSHEVRIGNCPLGGDHPLRIQSMTTTPTADATASAAQCRTIIEAGADYVRLTAQGTREAEALREIKEALRREGFDTPLVADIHFNPNVADVAAEIVEKVRINPGNYVDPARKFKHIEYTDEAYAEELRRLEERFVKLLGICRAHGTALRIGVNHGSLSDRIRNRYGDTPEGIVESCMEFLRICKRERFNDVVISVKASNTVVMVVSVRLLVARMEREDMHYPLHLGVTEAGEGEDGRIKSSVGIGALLADGIGDTVRVSLSEEPEAEIPVARHLVDYIGRKAGHQLVPAMACEAFDWLHPTRRPTRAVANVGGNHVPVVITSREGWRADYIYMGSKKPQHPDDGKRYIVDFNVYADMAEQGMAPANFYPIFPVTAMPLVGAVQAPLKFLVLQFGTPSEEYLACLKAHPEVVVVCVSNHQNRLGCQRALVHEMMSAGVENPVVFAQMYQLGDKEEFQLRAAADMGALMVDGLCDGLWLMNEGDIAPADIEQTSFAILQAARLRVSKTEYISCPGCGRTLYDLRTTIARIKEATKDMPGLKIGIMGCIVNGPGEMADADYGYVGAGVNRVSLYRRQVCVEKNIPQEVAVEHLLALIDNDRRSENEGNG